MPAAGRTASSARPRPVSTSRATGWPARGRRRARHGVTVLSTVPTPSRGHALQRFPARRTRFVCTCVSNSPARRPLTGTSCEPSSRRGPTRSCSSGWTTALSSHVSRSTRSSPPATPCSCVPRARRSRRGATTARVGHVSASSPIRPTAPVGTPVSVCAGRPAASKTSGRGRWARRANRPLGSAVARGERRQQPGRTLVERSQLERRLRAHDLHRVPLHDLGRPRKRALARPRPVHELHGHDGRERHHLLLRGEGEQRGRRVALLERGPATPSAPATAPSAPQSLAASAGNNQVSLSWSAPSSNGGSALTTYTVYRSTTSGVLGSALSPGPGLSTSYTDTTAANGTTYYYLVKASNAVGESLSSNEASGDAERACNRPLGSAVARGERRQQPGRTLVERSQLERRLRAHDLHRVPLHDLGRPRKRALARPRPVHELHGHDGRERHHLLLPGEGEQRGRRVALLERGLRRRRARLQPPPRLRSRSRRAPATTRSHSRGALPARTAAPRSRPTPCIAPRPRASSEARSRPAPACPRVTRTRRPRTAPPTTTW